MSRELDCAKPGDTIKLDPRFPYLPEQYVVIECPSDLPSATEGGPVAWFRTPSGDEVFARQGLYKIVKLANDKDQVESSVDKFLSRQRDDNLRNIFG